MLRASITALSVLGVMTAQAQTQAQEPAPPAREGIVFILGQDEAGHAPLYTLAEGWFRQHQTSPTLTSVHSLVEVRDYLASHAPQNGRPWGRVELVLHGNGQGQTDVAIQPGGASLSSERLEESCQAGSFKPLPDALMDDQSEIRMHGCALGKDEALLRAVSRAFGGPDTQRPYVSASRLFTCFRSNEDGLFRYFGEAWPITYPVGESLDGSMPSSALPLNTIAQRLRSLHPELGGEREGDIEAALGRQAARFPGDTFSYRAPIQFQCAISFGEPVGVPVPSGGSGLSVWLQRRRPFMNRLAAAHLRLEDLAWEAHPITREGGRSILQITGRGQSVYFMRAQADGIAWEDSSHCARVR